MPKKEKEFEWVCCANCGHRLCQEAIFMGKIRIKCRKCKAFNTFERVIKIEGEKEETETQIKLERAKKENKDG